MTKSYLIAALFGCVLAQPQAGFSQKDQKIAISVIDFFLPSLNDIELKKQEKTEDNPYRKSMSPATDIRQRMQKLQGFVANHFGGDARFVLIDRSSLNIIKHEQELQKSEQFLDGYVVGQGKNIGADYLLSGDFDLNAVELTISLFSVADQTVVGKEVVDMKKAFFNFAGNFRDPVVEGARRLAGRVFPVSMSVVEISEQKKDKAKALLIAGGLNRGLKSGQVLEIKTKDTREVDGVAQPYLRTVGTGKVGKVEDENFSILNVEEGEEEVKKLIDGGRKLFCTFKI